MSDWNAMVIPLTFGLILPRVTRIYRIRPYSMDLIGQIMSDSFKMEDPMGPFKTFFASTLWSPLADWPFMVRRFGLNPG
jgi:hypothetical protein